MSYLGYGQNLCCRKVCFETTFSTFFSFIDLREQRNLTNQYTPNMMCANTQYLHEDIIVLWDPTQEDSSNLLQEHH